MRKIYRLPNFLFMFLLSMTIKAQQVEKTKAIVEQYDPHYWLEGVADHRKIANATRAEITNMIDEVSAKGWQGIMYWGADRAGSKMNYYFQSPFLQKQDWATYKEGGLQSVVEEAHKKNLQVMVNMEGVNPYHWKQNHWTPENIKMVANDLSANNVNSVFEECFEVKPEVFISLAKTLKSNGVNYVSGTDPMLFREPNFSALWPETGLINIYNYYLKRDKIFNVATLAQNGTLGYGWAKYWNKPTSLISPLNRNWGIATDYSPAVVAYLCMIRALQFRLDNFIIFGGKELFDPIANRKWIKRYVDKQEKDRPLMNIVVLLKNQIQTSGNEAGNPGWNQLFNSGDAITSGAFNAGYNVVVSDKVLPADAYWIYTPGGSNDTLPTDVVNLLDANKPVFIQCGSGIPSGSNLSFRWKTVLQKCGVDGAKAFMYGGGAKGTSNGSLPADQEEEIPYTGYYKNTYLRFTGSDMQRGIDLRAGTIIPQEAINGTVYCAPNDTYGHGPYIVGKNNKYVVTATALNWEAAYPISNILSGGGILPSSNVWGIVGKNVTALLAIETTELDMTIPGLDKGAKIHVAVWDNKKSKKYEETVSYSGRYKHLLKEYDFIMIDRVK